MAEAKLVHLDGVACGRFFQHGRLARYDPFCPFFRTARTVSRLTPKARAIPRWLMRSESACSICRAFSSESVRGRPAGVKHLPHALQRSRSVPERLRPKRTTEAVSPQEGQDIATINLFYINALKAVAIIGLRHARK